MIIYRTEESGKIRFEDAESGRFFQKKGKSDVFLPLPKDCTPAGGAALDRVNAINLDTDRLVYVNPGALVIPRHGLCIRPEAGL